MFCLYEQLIHGKKRKLHYINPKRKIHTVAARAEQPQGPLFKVSSEGLSTETYQQKIMTIEDVGSKSVDPQRYPSPPVPYSYVIQIFGIRCL